MYNVRRPLKDLSSEEFVFGVVPVIEISLSDSTPKTNSLELRSLSGRLTLYFDRTFNLMSMNCVPRPDGPPCTDSRDAVQRVGHPAALRLREHVPAGQQRPGTNCIKIGLPGKLILSKRKGLLEVIFS